MKKLLGILVLGLLFSVNVYSKETQLICSYDRKCKNKSYEDCKKLHYIDDKKLYEGISDDEIEKHWLKLTTSFQIFDDKKISSSGRRDKIVYDKANINSDKYYVFYRVGRFNETRARFQISAFDRNNLINLFKNFDTTIASDGSIFWPEKINSKKKLLDYVNYMFIKYENPSYDDEKYVYESVGAVCKIVANVKPKF